MTNYSLITTPEELAYALIEQEYCESCHYNENGICKFFDADKEEINMHMACYNAAIQWLLKEEGGEQA